MNLPIRLRMTAWYVVLLAVVIAAVGAFLVVRLRADLVGTIDRDLRPGTGQIANDYAKDGTLVEFRDSARTVLKAERAAAQLLAPDGRVLTTFGDPVAASPMVRRGDLAAALDGRTVLVTRPLGSDGQDFRVSARRVTRGGEHSVVVAGESLRPVQRSVRRVVVLLLLAGPAALIAIALGGWWLARRALRPVEQMTSTAAAIGVDRLDDRVPEPPTRDELWHLARTLNTMLDRIKHGVEEQSRLVADASHELRTPLAAMRSEIDVSLRADDLSPASREVLASVREEVDRLSRTVDDLLTLATLDSEGLQLRAEPTDLAEATREVIAALGTVANRRNVAVELHGDSVTALVDPVRFRHAIRNIVENAVKFSPDGSTVTVTTSADGHLGRVVVADQGPGVPVELRERIFDRFFRADPSRARQTGGSGLGLAITRDIVEAHGGRVHVESRAEGSAFVVEVPQAPVSADPTLASAILQGR